MIWVTVIYRAREEPTFRITSYNVCYTKLLRFNINEKDTVVGIAASGGTPYRITSYNVCYTKLLRIGIPNPGYCLFFTGPFGAPISQSTHSPRHM